MSLTEILSKNWNPRIGDPSIMGWLTVAAYFGAAGLLLWKWRWAPAIYAEHLRAHQRILLGFAVLMIALGVNKQLDIQTWLTNVMRDVSKAQGWWEDRRYFQAAVLGTIVLAGVALLGVIVRLRGVMLRHRLTLLGFLFLVIFVVVRASSFFKMDRLINFEIAGVRMNWIFEFTGIGIIAWSAYRDLRLGGSAKHDGTG